MSLRLDAAALVERAACGEGEDWFSARFPDGVEPARALAVALADGRPEFVAWAALRLPRLRGSVPSEALGAVLGPRAEALCALADAVAAERATAGSPSVEDSDRTVWTRLATTHARRLARFGPVVTPAFVAVEAWSLERLALTLLADLEGAAAAEHHQTLPAPLGRAFVAALRAASAGLPEDVATERLRAAALASPPASSPHTTASALGAIAGWLAERLRPLGPVARQVEAALGDVAFVSVFAAARAALAPLTADGGPWARAGAWVDAALGTERCAAAAVTAAAAALAHRARVDASVAGLWLLADVDAPSPAEPLVALWARHLAPWGLHGGTFVLAPLAR